MIVWRVDGDIFYIFNEEEHSPLVKTLFVSGRFRIFLKFYAFWLLFNATEDIKGSFYHIVDSFITVGLFQHLWNSNYSI